MMYGLNKIISRDALASHISSELLRRYYSEWAIDRNLYPIERHAVLLTYWQMFDGRDRAATPMSLFARYHWDWLLKPLVRKARSQKDFLSKQPTGLYAVDYIGSRYGLRSEGAHIHALWIVHPKYHYDLIMRLNIARTVQINKFDIKPIRRTAGGFVEAISYVLKGVMHNDGFYPGRNDQWQLLGPR